MGVTWPPRKIILFLGDRLMEHNLGRTPDLACPGAGSQTRVLLLFHSLLWFSGPVLHLLTGELWHLASLQHCANHALCLEDPSCLTSLVNSPTDVSFSLRNLVSRSVVKAPCVHHLGEAISPLICPGRQFPKCIWMPHRGLWAQELEGRGSRSWPPGNGALSIFLEPISQRARVQRAPGSTPDFLHGQPQRGEGYQVRKEKHQLISISLPSHNVPSSWPLAQGRLCTSAEERVGP